MRRLASVPALALALIVAPGAAFAHPGHEAATFAAGVLHPMSGLDHLFTMVAVGVLASGLAGRRVWALPALFVAGMALGGVIGAALGAGSVAEMAVAVSVVLLGAALVAGSALAFPLLAGLAAAAVVAHGFVHGAEAAGTLAFAGGVLLATASLHAAGVAAGLALRHQAAPAALAVRGLAGGALGLYGLALLAGAA